MSLFPHNLRAYFFTKEDNTSISRKLFIINIPPYRSGQLIFHLISYLEGTA